MFTHSHSKLSESSCAQQQARLCGFQWKRFSENTLRLFLKLQLDFKWLKQGFKISAISNRFTLEIPDNFFTLISKTNVNNLQRGLRREEKPSAPGEVQRGSFKGASSLKRLEKRPQGLEGVS